MSRTNETVAILSIMSQIDKKSMAQALKDANKTMEDIEVGFDGQKFKKNLIKEYNDAIEEIYRLSPKINLSKLQHNALVNIVNSKDAESANNALEEYIHNIKILIDLTTSNKDNRTIFDNLSPKNIDKIIRDWEKLAEKRREYESIKSGENKKHHNVAKSAEVEARTLKELIAFYNNEEKFKQGRENAVSDKTISVLKSQLIINKALTDEQNKYIKGYSKLLDMYNQMYKLKPEFGTTDYVKWNKEMERISGAILNRESSIKEFADNPSAFREFLSKADGYTDAFETFTKRHGEGVTSAVTAYVDSILRTMKSEINRMNTEFLDDLVKYKDSDRSHAEKDAERLRKFTYRKKKIASGEESGGSGVGNGNGSGEGFSEENAELKKYIINAEEAKNKILELSKSIDKNKSTLANTLNLEEKDLDIAKEIFGYMQRYVDLNPEKTINELFSKDNGFSGKDFPGELLRKFQGQNLGKYADEINEFKNLIHSFSVEDPIGGSGSGGIFAGSIEQADELLELLTAIAEILDDISKRIPTTTSDVADKDLEEISEKISNSLSGILDKLKTDFNDVYSSFSDDLKNLDNIEWNFENLRTKLLDIVKEFQAALSAAGLEIKYANNVYEMLKGWNDADKAMNEHLDKTDKKNTVRERGAYFHSKTGKVSNSFFYDEKDEFSGELRDSIKKLVLNANEKVSDVFDTAIHSHPIHDVTPDNLYKTIGSNIAFSYSDLEAGINRVLKEHITNAMVTSGDRYTNLNLAGITEAQKDAFLKAYMEAALKSGAEKAEGGAKVSSFLVDDKNSKGKKLFDYDKLTAAVNDAIYAGLDAIGFDRNRLTTGHISDFDQNSDIGNIENIYQDNFAQLVSIAERILAVLNDISSNGFRFASSGDVGDVDVSLSPDSKTFKSKAAESLEMIYLDKDVELKPDVTEFEKDSNTVLTFVELDKSVGLKPNVDDFEENSNLKLNDITISKSVELIPDIGDRFTEKNIISKIFGNSTKELTEQEKTISAISNNIDKLYDVDGEIFDINSAIFTATKSGDLGRVEELKNELKILETELKKIKVKILDDFHSLGPFTDYSWLHNYINDYMIGEYPYNTLEDVFRMVLKELNLEIPDNLTDLINGNMDNNTDHLQIPVDVVPNINPVEFIKDIEESLKEFDVPVSVTPKISSDDTSFSDFVNDELEILDGELDIFDTESSYTFINSVTGEVLELKDLIDNATGELIHVTELLDSSGNIDASNYPNGLLDPKTKDVYYPGYLSEFAQDIKKTFSNPISKIDLNLKETALEFIRLLSSADDDIDWDFTNLRNELLGVVKKYRDALAEVGIDSKPLNEVYMMLKGWSDADIGISNAKSIYEDHSERAAYANLKTGKISNPYFYDKPGSVREEIFDEMEKLLPIEEIGDMFDTSIHSHNIRKFADTLGQPGMPTVGADIAFSPSDIISAISDAVHRNIPKSLVVNQGRYSLLDLSDLTNIESFYERFEKGELLQEAYLSIASKVDLPSYVNDNDEYDFNLLTNDINKGIADALEKVGFDRNLIKSGELSELNIEIPEEPRESNFTKLVSVVEKILSAVEYIKVNGLKASIDDQPSTTIDKDKASKNPYKDLVSKDFITNSKEESLKQLAEAYEIMKPFYFNIEQASTEEGRKAAYAYVQAWYDAWGKGLTTSYDAQPYLFDNYDNFSPLYGAFNIEEDYSFKHIVMVVEELSQAYEDFYDILGEVDAKNKPEFSEFENHISELIEHVKWLNDAKTDLYKQTTEADRNYYARMIEDEELAISNSRNDIKNLAISMREKYSYSAPESDKLIDSQDITGIQIKPKLTPEDFIKEIESILFGHFARVDIKPKDVDGNEFTTKIELDIDGSWVSVNTKPVIAPNAFIASIEADIADTPVRVNVVPKVDTPKFTNKIETDIGNGSTDETSFLDRLGRSLDIIITKIHEKTTAFKTEEGVVATSIPHETELIGKLNSSLHYVVKYLQSIQTEVGNLDFAKFANSEEFATFFDTFKNICEDLYLLKDEGSILDTFKVTSGNVSNIENLAYAVDLLKEALSSFDKNAKDALESLTLLSNQSDKLKDLYNVLKEANKASADTKDKISGKIETKGDTDKKSDKLGEAYKDITNSIGEYINLARLKASGVELNDVQLDRYNTLKDRIENAKKGVEAYASSVDGANAHQQRFNKTLEESYEAEGSKQIESLQDRLATLYSKKDDKTPAYADYLKALSNDITQLSNRLPLNFTDENELKTFYEEFSKIQKAMDNYNSKEFSKAKPLEVQNMTASFETWVSNNSAALKQFGDRIEEIRRSLGNIVSEADKDKVKMAIAELRAEVNKTGAAGRSMFDMWKQRAKSFMAYLGTYVGFQDVIQKLREGFEIAKTYDTQLTEMKKVSDETMASLKEFQQASFALGDSVGTTGQQIQASTADFMRLGESLDNAAQSALDANTLFKVSEFETIEEATEALISMGQAFQELEKSEINDIANHIGNNFAISTQGIAEGLKISAATLKTAGNDIYEAVALLTAGNSILQNPEQVAAGLRTISLRILGTETAKDELAALGEDVEDFVVQTQSKIDATVRDYTAVASNNFKGVSLLDDNGNYRSTYEILQDIADVYQEILDTDKKAGTNRGQALVELIAGKNRSNVAASILQNPELLQEVYKEAQNASGSAAKELEAQLDSIESHLERLQNKWQSIWITDYNREAINFVIDRLADILGLVEAIGILPIGTAAGGIFAFAKNFGQSEKDCVKQPSFYVGRLQIRMQ